MLVFSRARAWMLESKVDGLSALGAVFIFAFLLTPGDFLADHDAYFHIRIAEEISLHGFVLRIPSMAESIHAERYVDYHLLFHLAQVPFVWFTPDLVTAAKASTVVFAGFSVFALSRFLRRTGVSNGWFWIVLFMLGSPVFTGRFLFGRGITLFAGILFLFLLFLQQRRRYALFFTAFLSVWTYPGFPVLGLLAFLYAVAFLAREKRFDRSSPAALLGIVSGILLHPAFPHQFYGFWLEFVVHSFGAPGLEKIAEWLPPGSEVIGPALWMPVVVLGAAILGVRLKSGPMPAALLTSTVIFLLGVGMAMKPLEYVIPLIIAFSAPQNWGEWPSTLRRAAGGVLLGVILVWNLPDTYRRMELQMRNQNPQAAFEAADWIQSNADPGSPVLLNWGDYPLFMFRAPDIRFQFGLNPVYAYGKNPERYLLMRSFFEVTAVNFYVVPEFFGARYAVVNTARHPRAAETLLSLPDRARLVFRNAGYMIFDFPPRANGDKSIDRRR